jgi:D-alanyl-lipoteichoic acid acyltransferase DltB (MBOAT superfamily)
MKTVIADNLAPVVNTVYNDPTRHTGLPLVVATVFFAFQIYSDFAGYSYIAIGAAQVMGIKLMVNFRQPYFSKSVSEFWRRWHISLSTWFRDYVYIPLGGNRVVRSRQYLNLLIVFTISGLWHGANWVFVIWGMLHGLYIVSSMWFADWANKLKHGLRLQTFPALLGFLQVMITFALVCFAWIFFRANSVTDAFYIVTHLFAGRGSLAGIGLTATFPAVAGIVAVGVIEILQQKISIKDILPRQPFVVRWAGYYLIILMICLYGRFGKEQFIYFQF